MSWTNIGLRERRGVVPHALGMMDVGPDRPGRVSGIEGRVEGPTSPGSILNETRVPTLRYRRRRR